MKKISRIVKFRHLAERRLFRDDIVGDVRANTELRIWIPIFNRVDSMIWHRIVDMVQWKTYDAKRRYITKDAAKNE